MLEKLRSKARDLPLQPGVYLMRDAKDNVIYVGKSRKLRNRVSQYFSEVGPDSPKTRQMVAHVADFDYILCDTEIEALTLENALIKQYAPKYNIKLKDAKSYPYIKITVQDPFPSILMSRTRANDHAKYIGPYSSTSTVYDVIGTVKKALRLPSCHHRFPQESGKIQPCIYRQIGRCIAPCTGEVTAEEYRNAIRQAIEVLEGNTGEAKRLLTEEMFRFSEIEQYEAAARCRDSIVALDKLLERQKVVSDAGTERDVFALYEADDCSVMSVLFIRNGILTDHEQIMIPVSEIVDNDSLETMISQFYVRRREIPREILLGFAFPEEAVSLLEEYFGQLSGHIVHIRMPKRGQLRSLCNMAWENAKQSAKFINKEASASEKVLAELAELLHLEILPTRIESFDISNLGAEHITAGMITMVDASFRKSDYRVFRIRDTEGPDDYAAMREAVSRRVIRAAAENDTTFPPLPDLILLDGGAAHVSVIRALFTEMGVDIPVFGMVKDDYHKTRALTDGTNEISIARNRSVYLLIYRIQEEVHRFAVSRMQSAKTKAMRTSVLEKIPGIGPEKAKRLLRTIGSLRAVKEADIDTLLRVKGVGSHEAHAVFDYFHKETGEESAKKP